MNKDEILDSLKKKGFSEKIIDAVSKVKREEFVPDTFLTYAYEDIALPLDNGSTLSQPSTIAFMLSLLDLRFNHKILEIGSGSGYALALISEIIKNGKIYGLEINKRLAIKSKTLLSNDTNIEIINRSGWSGLPQFAPFDRILFSASAPNKAILYQIVDTQLADPGILVGPVEQSLYLIEKKAGVISEKEYPGFVFVPLKDTSDLETE